MSGNGRERGGERSISMSGLLSLMIGFGMLFIYVKFVGYYWNWSDFARIAYLMVGVGLFLWGLLKGFDRQAAGSEVGRRLTFLRQRVALPMLPRPGQFYLLMMIVLLVGSLLGRSNMLMLVFAMMAGPFVLNGWVTYSMLKKTDLSRRLPARVMAGEPASVEVVLENRKRLLSSWLMTARDRIQNAFERLDTEVLFARVPRRDRRVAHYQVRLMRRGKYQFGPMRLSTRFPLGLVERSLLFNKPGELLVYPRIGRMSSSWKRRNFRTAEMSERLEPRRGMFDDEFHHIREYRTGDNPRAIHWRTSARHNELMVCEYHQNRDQNLVVLLDLWQPESPGDEDYERVELGISLAATICVEQLKQSRDARLSLIAAGRDLSSWESRAGAATMETLLDLLAAVEAAPKPKLTELLELALTKRASDARMLLVTTRPQTPGSSEIYEAIAACPTVSPWKSELQIIHADPSELSAIFQLV